MKPFASLALLLTATFAHAGLSEIKANFVGLTGPLAPTPIFAAAPSAANYLICVAYGLEPILAWTDENGVAQSAQLGSGALGLNNCRLIRNGAQTAATVQCSTGPCSGPAPYSMYLFGFGFWPGQTQKQAGLGETFGDGPATLAGGDYLFAITAPSGCQWTATWGGSTESGGEITGSASALLALNVAAPGKGKSPATYSVQNYNNPADSGCQINTAVIAFGTPATGPGPLTDYEADLLNWTSATYPYYDTVFNAGAAGANFVLATNIAEKPNPGTVAEEITPVWSGAILPVTPSDFVAEPSGAPASVVVVGSVPANAPVKFWTFNTTGKAWGSSPPYSAEVDIVQF